VAGQDALGELGPAATATLPAPAVPARVTGLRITQNGRRATIVWNHVANAVRYVVHVKVGTTNLALVTNRTAITVDPFRRGETMNLTIAGEDAASRSGPQASVVARSEERR
jgi:hypothetical protein